MEGATETEKEGRKIAWTEERSNNILKVKCVCNFVQKCVLFESINQIKKVIKFVKDHQNILFPVQKASVDLGFCFQ